MAPGFNYNSGATQCPLAVSTGVRAFAGFHALPFLSHSLRFFFELLVVQHKRESAAIFEVRLQCAASPVVGRGAAVPPTRREVWCPIPSRGASAAGQVCKR